jgi:parallel beta-helix repeat protein
VRAVTETLRTDVYVLDTVSRQNGAGFYFQSITGTRASIDSVRGEENLFYGVGAGNNSLVTVTRSVAAGTTYYGFAVFGSSVINIESCTVTMNDHGIYADGTARVRNSTITANPIGLGGSGSRISFGNNGLHGNGINGNFTSTVAQY